MVPAPIPVIRGAGSDWEEVGAPPLEVRLLLGGPENRLSIVGEVDMVTAGDFARVVEVAVASTPARLVVELDRADFFGLDGLAALDAAERQLSEERGTLVISGATPTVVKAAVATGLCASSEFSLRTDGGPPLDDGTAAGPEPEVDWRQLMASAGTTDLVDSVLELATALTVDLIPAAGDVSVSLLRAGALRTVAAHGEVAVGLDAAQYSTGDGPCVQASKTGILTRATPLSGHPQWADLATQAHQVGIGGLLSAPLTVASRPVGALNVYSASTDAISAADEEAALRLAGHFSRLLHIAGAGDSGGNSAEAQAAMWSARETIAQAQGVVMEREGLSPAEAFAVLRRFSVSRDRPLVDLALEVVSSASRGRAV